MSGAPKTPRDAREEATPRLGSLEVADFKIGASRQHRLYRWSPELASLCGTPCREWDACASGRLEWFAHYCILPANHEGPCDFVRKCRRSLDRGE